MFKIPNPFSFIIFLNPQTKTLDSSPKCFRHIVLSLTTNNSSILEKKTSFVMR
jgi:hypothetical protein